MVCWQVGTEQKYTFLLERSKLSFAVRRLIASDGAGCVPGESLELQNKGDYVEFILIIRLHIWVSQSLNFFHVWVSWRFGVFLI
jgi:hypothetical protein